MFGNLPLQPRGETWRLGRKFLGMPPILIVDTGPDPQLEIDCSLIIKSLMLLLRNHRIPWIYQHAVYKPARAYRDGRLAPFCRFSSIRVTGCYRPLSTDPGSLVSPSAPSYSKLQHQDARTMRILTVVSLLATATLAASQAANVTTGKLGDARPVRNNPVIGERWVATFNSSAVKGTVTAVAHTVGINYTIDVTGLAVEKGPYSEWP